MRTVGVKLEAQTGPYTRDVDKAGRSTRGLKDEIDGVAKSSQATGRKVDDLGGDFRDTARDAQKLQNEIQSVKRSLAGLAVEFAATSSAADRLDLTKSIRRQQGELRQLLRIDRLLPNDQELKTAGRSFGQKLAGVITGGLSVATSGPAIAAAAVAAAPLIGASVAGAVVGAAGVGGVVGGLVLAARDPRVKQAGTKLGEDLLGDLERRAVVFVGPALVSVDKIRRAYQAFGDDLDRVFADSVHLVDPLVDGALAGASKMGHGFADAVSQARPVADQLGITFDRLGQAGGDFLSQMSRHADDGARAIGDLTDAVAGFIDTTGEVIGGLATVYGWYSKVNDEVENFTHGLSIIEALNPNRPFKMLYDGLKDLTGASDEADTSLRRTGSGTFGAGQAAEQAAVKVDAYADVLNRGTVETEDLQAAQDALKAAEQGLGTTLDRLSGKMGLAGRNAAALRTAMDNLYGASIRQTDANEDFQASFDDLSVAVKANAGQFKHNRDNLNLHTRAGRANRDALEALLTKSNELYIADVAAGVGVAQATKKHQARTAAVKEESRRVGLNKTATDELIHTYGRIPKKKATDLVLDGVKSVARALDRLYKLQRALALGININLVEGTGTVKDFKAAGGVVRSGLIPGRPSRVDNVLATSVDDGRGVAVATGEFIVNAAQTRKHRRTLESINAGAEGFADGGYFGPVDESRRWPYDVSLRHTKIPSQAAVEAKVAPPPGARTSDWIVRVVRAAFPGMEVLSKDRPGARTLSGNRSYHALGRAVDFRASRPLAEWWNLKYKARTREFISPWNDLNIHNGRRRAYTGDVYRQHSGSNAHNHVAMAGGGVIREPIAGVGASGRTYSFGERGVETVTPGTYIPGGSAAAAGPTFVLQATFTGPVGSRMELDNWLVASMDRLKYRGRV